MAIEISVRKKQLESSWQLNTLKNVSEDIKQVLILIRAVSRVFWRTLFFEMVIFPCRHNGCEGFLELSTLTWNSGYLPRSHHGWFFENHAQDALKIHSRKCLNKPRTNLSVSYKSNFLLTGAVKSDHWQSQKSNLIYETFLQSDAKDHSAKKIRVFPRLISLVGLTSFIIVF